MPTVTFGDPAKAVRATNQRIDTVLDWIKDYS